MLESKGFAVSKAKELLLKDREYHCVACGNAMDRDHNAAKNIYRLGISLAAEKLLQKQLALC